MKKNNLISGPLLPLTGKERTAWFKEPLERFDSWNSVPADSGSYDILCGSLLWLLFFVCLVGVRCDTVEYVFDCTWIVLVVRLQH